MVQGVLVLEESAPKFLATEEGWFKDGQREKKRPLRTSPTTPPPPIGDAMADRWFR